MKLETPVAALFFFDHCELLYVNKTKTHHNADGIPEGITEKARNAINLDYGVSTYTPFKWYTYQVANLGLGQGQ